MLTLEVLHTDEEIQEYREEQRRLDIHCRHRDCKHVWRATIGEMMDDPTCRKCKR